MQALYSVAYRGYRISRGLVGSDRSFTQAKGPHFVQQFPKWEIVRDKDQRRLGVVVKLIRTKYADNCLFNAARAVWRFFTRVFRRGVGGTVCVNDSTRDVIPPVLRQFADKLAYGYRNRTRKSSVVVEVSLVLVHTYL
jgi:hypothetical protein